MFDCESFKVEIEDAQGSNHFLYQSKNTFVLSNAAKGKECWAECLLVKLDEETLSYQEKTICPFLRYFWIFGVICDKWIRVKV